MPQDNFRSKNLNLPFIAPAQAMKHVTVNEAVRSLDALVQISVIDRDVADPPLGPEEGDRYIIPASASGAWAGHDNKLAAWQDGAWAFYTAQVGWRAWCEADEALIVFTNDSWQPLSTDAEFENLQGVGIGTASDITNKLAVKSPASLFSHDGDDHRLKINKAASGDTASLLCQTNYSGRAELGLTGDDDFRIKVSANGSAWSDAIIADKSDGNITVSRLHSGTVFVAKNGGLASIATPTGSAGGFVLIIAVSNIYPQAPFSGILVYDTGVSLYLASLALAQNLVNKGTVVLDGANGSAGKLNVAVKAGALSLANQYSHNLTISYTFIGGV